MQRKEPKMAANSKNHWITQRETGWADIREGASRASRIYDTQHAAFEAARKSARREGGEVFIHNKEGQIRERNTYGKSDPYPPKD